MSWTWPVQQERRAPQAEDKGNTKAERSGTYDGHAGLREYKFAMITAKVGERCREESKQGLKTMLRNLDFIMQATVKAFQARCRNDQICTQKAENRLVDN